MPIIPKKIKGLTMKKIDIKIKKPKQRVTWGFNPTCMVKKNRKIYSRKNYKVEVS
jgi:adenylate cyclase class IV